MKNKLMFVLLTDVLLYLLHAILTYALLIKYFHSLELNGESGIGIIIVLGYFIGLTIISVIIQWLNSLTFFSSNNANLPLNIRKKKIVFLCQNILLFGLLMVIQVIRFSNDYSETLQWIFYFVVFSTISFFIYRKVVNSLAIRCKLGVPH